MCYTNKFALTCVGWPNSCSHLAQCLGCLQSPWQPWSILWWAEIARTCLTPEPLVNEPHDSCLFPSFLNLNKKKEKEQVLQLNTEEKIFYQCRPTFWSLGHPQPVASLAFLLTPGVFLPTWYLGQMLVGTLPSPMVSLSSSRGQAGPIWTDHPAEPHRQTEWSLAELGPSEKLGFDDRKQFGFEFFF